MESHSAMVLSRSLGAFEGTYWCVIKSHPGSSRLSVRRALSTGNGLLVSLYLVGLAGQAVPKENVSGGIEMRSQGLGPSSDRWSLLPPAF